MPIDYTKIKKKIQGQADPFPVDELTLRTGVISAVNANGTVNLMLSGVTMTNVPVLATGQTMISGLPVQVLSARGSLLVIGHIAGTNMPSGRRVIIKPSSQNLTASSTTMQNVTGMSFTVEANATYLVETIVTYDGATGGDIRVAWTAPGASSMSRFIVAPQAGTTSNENTAVVMIRRSIGTQQIAGAPGGVTSAFTDWHERGILRTDSAGTVQLQAAQGTSSGTVTVVQGDSIIIVERVA